MRILLLSDVNSSHTQKWALSLAQNGVEIGIFSLRSVNTDAYNGFNNIRIFGNEKSGSTFKISYLKTLPQLKNTIKEFKPDIVHAHYATSYGLLGALSGFHPFIISVWGSDVYEFPNKSFLHRALLKYNLKRADKVLSTSKIMAIEAGKYTTKNITVIPFGIDTLVFKPSRPASLFKSDDVVVGTVKMLEKVYGISYLLKAFAIVKGKHLGLPLKLLIVGSGSQVEELRKISRELKIGDDTFFKGFVPPAEVPEYQNIMSISVFPSMQESFGVSVLEASACEKPVIVSNVGGLPEVVEDAETGIIVPHANADKLADAIEKLVLDKDLRIKMGIKGRQRVEKLYNWHDNVKQMIEVYQNACNSQF